MRAAISTVFLIDPDPSTHGPVSEVASSLNLSCKAYTSGREFLAAYPSGAAGCLVLEVKIPDMSGLQIQRRLAADGISLPLVFLSGHTDVSLAVELMRGGAVHYLQKPLRQVELLNAIQEAVALDMARRRAAQRRRRLSEGIALLAAREREVLCRIGEGKTSRMIASELGLVVRTVELRRASLMRKLGLESSLALLRFAILALRYGRLHSKGPHSSETRRRTRNLLSLQHTA